MKLLHEDNIISSLLTDFELLGVFRLFQEQGEKHGKESIFAGYAAKRNDKRPEKLQQITCKQI